MPTEEQITFHLISMAGSVEELQPFLTALLHWTRCRFVLVGNGTSTAEDALPADIAARKPPVTLRLLDNHAGLMGHGALLELLLRTSHDEHFTFLDSAIVVDRPFMPELLTAPASADVVFSGTPLTFDARDFVVSERSTLLAGRHAHTRRGDVGRRHLLCDHPPIRRNILERAQAAASTGLRPAVRCQLSAANRRVLQRHQRNHLTPTTRHASPTACC